MNKDQAAAIVAIITTFTYAHAEAVVESEDTWTVFPFLDGEREEIISLPGLVYWLHVTGQLRGSTLAIQLMNAEGN